MQQQIWIFGYSPKKAGAFHGPEGVKQYISEEIFTVDKRRYLNALMRNLNDGDIIVISQGGFLYGHLEISGWEKPDDEDRKVFASVKRVYLVQRSALYETPVPLATIGNPNIHFGKAITEEQFQQIMHVAGAPHHFPDIPALPKSPVALERTLRAVKERLGQTEFKKGLLHAYGNRCAVTDCDAVEALEAAHIDPYSGPQSNQCSNGLLLRGDIHTLFDRNILSINPETLEVTLSSGLLRTSYADLHGKRINLPAKKADQPNRDVLEKRWQQFPKPSRMSESFKSSLRPARCGIQWLSRPTASTSISVPPRSDDA